MLYDGAMLTGPVNAFAANPLDRGGDRRYDDAWIAEQAAQGQALAMALVEGAIRLEATAEGERLAWGPLDRLAPLVDEPPLFLGLWNQAPVFAVSVPPERAARLDDMLGPGTTPDLRSAALRLPAGDLAMAGVARALFDWHGRNRFCAACGQASGSVAGGWKRRCPACGTEHYPRVDPVCIMLPVYSGGPEPVCLLGRQASWPQGRMSALAGFIEPGESLEEACAREVGEEAGLEVRAVRYHSSQPWPFPHQLMIGLIAEVTSADARPDEAELEAVAWLTRDQARAVLDGRHPDISAPFPFAIAHTLIRAWVEEG